MTEAETTAAPAPSSEDGSTVEVVKPRRVGPIAMLRLGPRMLSDMPSAMTRLQRRYGDVVDFGFGPQRFVFAFGAEANRAILHDQADAFLWGPILETLVPIDGPTALVVTDGDEHDRRRRLVQPAFHVRRINSYLATMLAEVDATIDAMPERGVVDVHAAFRSCVRRIVLRCLAGDELAASSDDLGDELELAIAYVQRPPTARIDRRWFPPYRRAMAAKARADERIFAEIARRRALLAGGGEPGDDVLWWLIEAAEGDDGLSDDEIRDQVVSLVAAGYDTTSAAVGWALHAVHAHPEVLGALRQEVTGVDLGADAATLNGLPVLGAVISESMRLWPAGIVSGRRTQREVVVDGRRIPAGRDVIYSAYVTQRLERHFADPDRFDIGRWLDGPAVEPYVMVPFGGGSRRCIGHAFATLEIEAIVARFVQRVDARATGPTPRGAGVATWAPDGGVPLEIIARR